MNSSASDTSLVPPQDVTRTLTAPAAPAGETAVICVAEVTVPGKLERELTIELKPEALQASGVAVSQVVQALQLQNLAAPVGNVKGALDEKSIRLKGRLVEPPGEQERRHQRGDEAADENRLQ